MITIVISVFIIAVTLGFFFLIFSKIKSSGGKKTGEKSRASLMKEASKRLNQNPRDVQGLTIMGNIHYQEKNWEKAYAVYSVLIDRIKTVEADNQADIAIKYGISSLKTNRVAEAKKGLLLAETMEPTKFDVNYTLGYIYYGEKDYERALPYLRKSLIAQPNNFLATKYAGYTLQKLHKYNQALPALKKALDVKPDDKEVLFAMGECFYEAGATDKCLRVLNHLRVDPVFGPRATLYTGMIRVKSNQLERGIEDFEIGLKHNDIPVDTANELRYRLAKAYIKNKEIGKALALLKDIQTINPAYKDVASLIMRYQELNQNKNLQSYLMSGQSEFVGLCRKIVARFYPRAIVKILDISVLASHTDIVASVDAARFSDTVIFRFFRSQSNVGELLLRDFHGRLKETKGGSGVCMSAGTFTDEALRYAEGRPIDLYDKTKLSTVLNSLK